MKPLWSAAAATFCSVLFCGGQTWTKTDAPNKPWSSIAYSADARRLIAVYSSWYEYGAIFTSTNFGLTWISNNVPGDWWSVSCSAEGTSTFACEGNGGRIAISTNGSSSWETTTPETNVSGCFSMSTSADGQNLVLSGERSISTDIRFTNQSLLYISHDAGAKWQASLTNAQWSDGSRYYGATCASSADGSVLLCMPWSDGTGAILVSTNTGLNWVTNSISSDNLNSGFVYYGAACSANGRTLAACSYIPPGMQGVLYVSTNCGTTWTRTNVPALAVACSADGSKLVASDLNGFIYRSHDAGATWTHDYLGVASWPVHVASSADGCKRAAVVDDGGIYTWQTSSTPFLNIACSITNLFISWVVPSQPFVLEESPNMANWSAVSAGPVLNYTNLHNEVNLPLPTAPRFYRLAMQQ